MIEPHPNSIAYVLFRFLHFRRSRIALGWVGASREKAEPSLSFLVPACPEKVTGMPETSDRGTIPVDGLKLALVLTRKCRDIVEKGAGVKSRLKFEISENDHWFSPVIGAG